MRNVKIVAGTAPQLTFLFSFTPIVLIHSLSSHSRQIIFREKSLINILPTAHNLASSKWKVNN